MIVKMKPGDLRVMAQTVWGEARGDGFDSMLAVAYCILNRCARPSRFGTSITAVCLAKWQFSCHNDTDVNKAKLEKVDESDKQYQLALLACLNAVLALRPDPTFGADHYCLTHMPNPPNWAKVYQRAARVGSHTFYRELPQT